MDYTHDVHCPGGVLGYAQQVTKCCNCSGFIEVLDASNQVVYTTQGMQSQSCTAHVALLPLLPVRCTRGTQRLLCHMLPDWSQGALNCMCALRYV